MHRDDVKDEVLLFVGGSDDVKAAEEPGPEAEILKVEVVDEVKTSEAEEADGKTDGHPSEHPDASAHVDDGDHVKNDEQAGELSVDVDKDSKQALGLFLFTIIAAKQVMFLHLSVCLQNNSKSY